MATTWFAQISSTNIDAWAVTQSMIWNDAANGLGNWMQGANFTAGLGAGDVLCANGNTGLAINVDITCLRISTDAEGGPNGTGNFTVSSARTITANILGRSMVSGGIECLTISGSGYQLYIAGNITGGSGGFAVGVSNAVAVDVHVTGTISGGSGGDAVGLNNTGTGNLFVTAASNAVVGGSGSSTNYGVSNTGTLGTIGITGSIVGNAASGIYANSTQTITVYGDIVGNASYGVNNNSTGAIIVYGNVIANAVSGICNNNNGVVTVYSGNLINTSTAQAVNGLISVYNPGTSNYIRCPQTSGTVDLAPEQAANVRSGTPDGNVTGTMAVPLAAQVLYNVPVDNTVGTYVEAPAAQVSLGTHFGPSSSYTGTDLPASGPLVGAGGLVE
jgi:hypothetical protein